MNDLPSAAEESGDQFAAWVCSSREELGWSVRELARRAGVSHNTVDNLESRRVTKPQLATRHKLTAALREALEPPPPPSIPAAESFRDSFDARTNPAVPRAVREHPELFAGWSSQDLEELASTFGTGGELNEAGVLESARRINRARTAREQLSVVMETHLSEVAARMVETLYQLVVPEFPDAEPGIPEATRG